jgi:4-amino-4-deoxy-L-arabinose transferase-like glycosyltransferase
MQMTSRRVIFALTVVLFLWNLGGHDLWAPDEPYFGEGAREMVVDGQWIVPHVNGVVSTDKPPLFFWSIAAFSLMAGEVTPWAARLPSALAALGTLLLIFRLGRRLGNERVAVLAGFVMVTSLMFWEKARWAQIDAMLTFLIWVALSAFEAWRAGDADGRRAGLLFWLAAALAVLAKGPVGLLLPLGIALVVLTFDRRLKDWWRFAPLLGPLLFAVVVGAWMAAADASPDYSVWGALRTHFVDRGIHGLHHKQPPWYYLEVLPLHLLPWSALVPGALVLAYRRRRPADRLLLVVCLFVVVFFSISTEKRDLYVLPAVPAFALLVAMLLDRLAFSRDEQPTPELSSRWLFVGQWILGGLLTLAGAAVPVVGAGRDDVPFWIAILLGAVLLVTGLSTLLACFRSSARAAALTPAFGFAVAYLLAVTFLYPALEPIKSARAFSLVIKQATAASRAAGQTVVAFDIGNLPEAFAFYGDGLYTVETEDLGAVAEHLRRPREVWAVVRGSALERLPEDVREQLVVVAEDRLSRRVVALVTNRP